MVKNSISINNLWRRVPTGVMLFEKTRNFFKNNWPTYFKAKKCYIWDLENTDLYKCTGLFKLKS